ncbi:hypothetical protein C3K47_05510 [Solitalea longa]|uniref:Outer membrane protein beta-barrel domain-containing protein n=1 Tax=Solitalea longa TaxID=2079460 RepID=A0A2S5A6L2_9SPHI|nr:hypothetical protein [Solitalea longa]POY37982.1 hypothetical protein C3K47_05510 [Solitalea longa]
MKKLLSLTVIVLLFAATTVKAQSYTTALGARIGTESGITLKHFIKSKAALEGILAFDHHSFDITGLYEVQGNAFSEPGLDWFVGGGAHIGSFRYHHNDYDDHAVKFGLDGILGLEYTFAGAPINVGVDWKPEINFTGYDDHNGHHYGEGFYADNFALSVRFTFGR